MKVFNVEIEYHIDYLGKAVHLLETNKTISPVLPNVISSEFQEEFVDKELLLSDVLGFEWFLYCSGGLVFAFDNYNLNLITKEDKRLNKAYLSRITGH